MSTRAWVTGGVLVAVAAAATPLYLLYRPGSAYRRAQQMATEAKTPAAAPDPFVEPRERLERFFSAVEAERFDEAYGLMAPSYKANATRDRFVESVKANANLRGVHDLQIVRARTTNGTRELQGTLRNTTGPLGLLVFESRDDTTGAWRLTGLHLGGMPALPTR